MTTATADSKQKYNLDEIETPSGSSGEGYVPTDAPEDGDFIYELVRISEGFPIPPHPQSKNKNPVLAAWFNFEIVGLAGLDLEESNIGRESSTRVPIGFIQENGSPKLYTSDQSKVYGLVEALTGMSLKDFYAAGYKLSSLIGQRCKGLSKVTFNESGEGRSWLNDPKPLNDKQKAKHGVSFPLTGEQKKAARYGETAPAKPKKATPFDDEAEEEIPF